MAALSQQFPGEELLLALGGQEVRRWLGGMLVATHSGVAAGRQPAVQEVVAMDLSVSLPDHGGPPRVRSLPVTPCSAAGVAADAEAQ